MEGGLVAGVTGVRRLPWLNEW